MLTRPWNWEFHTTRRTPDLSGTGRRFCRDATSRKFPWRIPPLKAFPPSLSPIGPAHKPFAQRHSTITAAYGITTRHESRTRRCALHLYVEVRQTQTLVCQPVQSWRRRASNDPTTIEAGLTPTEIIQKNEDNVRFFWQRMLIRPSVSKQQTQSILQMSSP